MNDGVEALAGLILLAVVAVIVLYIFDWDFRCLVVDCVIVKP
jgi:hypothetical protein